MIVMFTGIVEEIGTVTSAEASAMGRRLVFQADAVVSGTGVGDSIAVNGCCLTVVGVGSNWWAADAVAETLQRTNLGSLRAGDPVNLERPLRLDSRLGGHLVQGHVDGVGHIVQGPPDLEIRFDSRLSRYLVEKGSITVDGISLTVVSVTDESFRAAVIPHTVAVTTIGRKGPGDGVNLEVDIIAKYAARLWEAGAATPYTDLSLIGEDER